MENWSLSAAKLSELLLYLHTQQSNGLLPQISSILSNLEAAHTGSQLHTLATHQSVTSSLMPNSTFVHPSASANHLCNSEDEVNLDSVCNQTLCLHLHSQRPNA